MLLHAGTVFIARFAQCLFAVLPWPLQSRGIGHRESDLKPESTIRQNTSGKASQQSKATSTAITTLQNFIPEN